MAASDPLDEEARSQRRVTFDLEDVSKRRVTFDLEDVASGGHDTDHALEHHGSGALTFRHSWMSPTDVVMHARQSLMPRKEHSHGHKFQEHWLELLNDLILVAFFQNLGHILLGENSFENYLLVWNVFQCVLNSSFFVSVVANLWLVQDVFMLLMMLVITTGTFTMADAMQSNTHFPCRHSFSDNSKRLSQFYLGLIMSSVGRLLVMVRASVHTEAFRPLAYVEFVKFVLAVASADTVPQPLLVCIAANVLELVYWILFTRTPSLVGMLDAAHAHSRMGILVVISLGEWVMQTITHRIESWEMSFSAGQLFFCFGMALQYFNTRPHSIADELLQTRPFFVVFGICSGHLFLSFMLFLAGTALDLQMLTLEVDHAHGVHEQGTNDTLPHAAARFLVSSGCKDTVVWKGHGIYLWSNSLAVVQILLACMRNVWKRIVLQEQGRPKAFCGAKFRLRLLLACGHFLVPVVLDNFVEDGDAILQDSIIAHMVLLVPQLLLDSLVRYRSFTGAFRSVTERERASSNGTVISDEPPPTVPTVSA